MEFRVLGPLRVRANGVAVPLGPRKQQVVLALLAVNAGRVVTVDELVDEVWPDSPPASAVANVRSYAATLRRLLAAVGYSGMIGRHGHGYLFDLGWADYDLTAFREGQAAGAAALRNGDPASAVAGLTEALDLWRGPMLAALPRGPQLTARCLTVEEDRLASVESLAEACLGVGDHTRAAALLREHVSLAPLRERGHELLMRALRAGGDTAGALRAYAEARSTLVGQLGVEPGPALRRLQQSILAATSEQGQPHHGPAVPVPAGSVPAGRLTPRELPPDVGRLVGRQDETKEILHVLTPPEAGRRRPIIVVLYGPGGAGKSALAVHVAHQAADHYRDGQLYVDLFGSTPGLRALTAREIVDHLLAGLGVRSQDIPTGEAEAVGLFRTLVANRRVLVILDNADRADDVQRVLPAGGESAVIVTTRRPLASVEADFRVRLEGLSAADGLALLTRLTSNRPISTAVARQILDLCGHLPLAVRIAAGRLAGRPDLAPEEFADRLANRERRLDELELDGLAVRTCIQVGYEAVASGPDERSQLAARAFRALGLLNTPDASPEVVAAMLAVPDVELVRSALDQLTSVELLEPVPGGRYRLHDLVRLAAAELAATVDDLQDRKRCVFRAVAYYAAGMNRAYSRYTSGRLVRPLPAFAPDVAVPDFTDPDNARRWVDVEFPSTVAALEMAGRHGGELANMITWCAEGVWHYCYGRHEWVSLERLLDAADAAASTGGDVELTAWVLLARGRILTEAGEVCKAMTNFRQALGLYQAVERWEGVALTHIALGLASESRGDLVEAMRHLNDCVETSRAHGLPGGEALALLNIGNVAGLARWLDRALSATKASAALRRAAGDRGGLGAALSNLAIIEVMAGNCAEAFAHADESLCITRLVGDQRRELYSLLTRSEVHFRDRRFDDAVLDVEAAISLARAHGHRYLTELGCAQLAKIRAVGAGQAMSATYNIERALAGSQTRRDPLLERLLLGGVRLLNPGERPT